MTLLPRIKIMSEEVKNESSEAPKAQQPLPQPVYGQEVYPNMYASPSGPYQKQPQAMQPPLPQQPGRGPMSGRYAVGYLPNGQAVYYPVEAYQAAPLPPPPQQHLKVTSVRKKRRKKDPRAPKNPISAYLFFVAEKRMEMSKKSKDTTANTSFASIAKELGRAWREMDTEGRAPYVALAHQDKQRYVTEKEEYDKRMHEETIAHSHSRYMSMEQSRANYYPQPYPPPYPQAYHASYPQPYRPIHPMYMQQQQRQQHQQQHAYVHPQHMYIDPRYLQQTYPATEGSVEAHTTTSVPAYTHDSADSAEEPSTDSTPESHDE